MWYVNLPILITTNTELTQMKANIPYLAICTLNSLGPFLRLFDTERRIKSDGHACRRDNGIFASGVFRWIFVVNVETSGRVQMRGLKPKNKTGFALWIYIGSPWKLVVSKLVYFTFIYGTYNEV